MEDNMSEFEENAWLTNRILSCRILGREIEGYLLHLLQVNSSKLQMRENRNAVNRLRMGFVFR